MCTRTDAGHYMIIQYNRPLRRVNLSNSSLDFPDWISFAALISIVLYVCVCVCEIFTFFGRQVGSAAYYFEKHTHTDYVYYT